MTLDIDRDSEKQEIFLSNAYVEIFDRPPQIEAEADFIRRHAELVPNLAFDHRAELLISYSWDGSTRFWQAKLRECAVCV